ncbi:RNA methyltransferase [Acetobacteraceae bacterium]|nr:RNA methyltransferase [Acetobacteraceae bacterium]
MTGRGTKGANLAPTSENDPVIILVRPQLADNIGTTARAMANGGLFHLRLVSPRDGWPQSKAWSSSSGAYRILEEATVFKTVEEATTDLHRVFATCPRPREATINLMGPQIAGKELRRLASQNQKTGILFGCERAGLDKDELTCADTLVRYPLNPDFMSLNLAQAVLIMAYEWWNAGHKPLESSLQTPHSPPAEKGEIDNFLNRLVDRLDHSPFLRNKNKRDGMVRNIRQYFQRGSITEQELRTLHGIISALGEEKERRKQEN